MARIAANLGWEHFSHEADVGIYGFAPTLGEAFEQAALALTAIVTSKEVAAISQAEVTCQDPDYELLFVDWLNAIICQMATRQMLFGRFAVRIEGTRLHGTLWGEPIDRKRHDPACEPKGATYTALRVAHRPDGVWCAGCVVDV